MERSVCVECDYFSRNEEHFPICTYCKVKKFNSVTGYYFTFMFCEFLNTEGRCDIFKPKRPWWKRLLGLDKPDTKIYSIENE